MSAWSKFLEARADVIDWFHSDGHDDETIAATLSMTEGRVASIRKRPRPYEITTFDPQVTIADGDKLEILFNGNALVNGVMVSTVVVVTANYR